MISRTFSDVSRSAYLFDLHAGVDRLDRDLGGVDLGLADAVDRVQDLALEVRDVDDVGVDDPEGADARCGQVDRGRRAEPARADQEHLRVEQPELALLADLRDEHVAAVALELLGVQGARDAPVMAVLLPGREAARHRDDVLVAELRERLGRVHRAVARRAVDDDRRRPVGDVALDPALEVAARDVDGAGDVPLLILIALADVENRGRGLAREALGRLGRRLLADLPFHGSQMISIRLLHLTYPFPGSLLHASYQANGSKPFPR